MEGFTVDNYDNLDLLGPIEDEVDCAILRDKEFAKSLEDIDSAESTAEEETEDEEIDLKADYSDDIHSPDMVDMDADDVLAAERDIMENPFADDEIIDIAINGDEESIIDDMEDEEE